MPPPSRAFGAHHLPPAALPRGQGRSLRGLSPLPSRPRGARMGGVAPRGSAATGRAMVPEAGEGTTSFPASRIRFPVVRQRIRQPAPGSRTAQAS